MSPGNPRGHAIRRSSVRGVRHKTSSLTLLAWKNPGSPSRHLLCVRLRLTSRQVSALFRPRPGRTCPSPCRTPAAQACWRFPASGRCPPGWHKPFRAHERLQTPLRGGDALFVHLPFRFAQRLLPREPFRRLAPRHRLRRFALHARPGAPRAPPPAPANQIVADHRPISAPLLPNFCPTAASDRSAPRSDTN